MGYVKTSTILCLIIDFQQLKWYVIGTNEGHGFAKKANADFQFYATVLFVQRYLLN